MFVEAGIQVWNRSGACKGLWLASGPDDVAVCSERDLCDFIRLSKMEAFVRLRVSSSIHHWASILRRALQQHPITAVFSEMKNIFRQRSLPTNFLKCYHNMFCKQYLIFILPHHFSRGRRSCRSRKMSAFHSRIFERLHVSTVPREKQVDPLHCRKDGMQLQFGLFRRRMDRELGWDLWTLQLSHSAPVMQSSECLWTFCASTNLTFCLCFLSVRTCTCAGSLHIRV